MNQQDQELWYLLEKYCPKQELTLSSLVQQSKKTDCLLA